MIENFVTRKIYGSIFSLSRKETKLKKTQEQKTLCKPRITGNPGKNKAARDILTAFSDPLLGEGERYKGMRRPAYAAWTRRCSGLAGFPFGFSGDSKDMAGPQSVYISQ